MPRPDFRATFENGEFSEDWLQRADIEQLPRACQSLKNMLLKGSGGAMRRPGTSEQAVLQGQSRLFRFHGRTATEDLVFSNGRLDVYSTSGVLTSSITTGCPWTTAQLARLKFSADKDVVFVFHTEFMPQVLTRASNGTWTRADFAFATAIGSNPAQPYYDRFDDIDVTMTVNAYSGTGRTMTFSADVLNTDGSHVGVRFRYLTRCEMEITAVTDAQTATVTIHDPLYPTLTVTVADSSGYKVGQVVEGSISQVRGIVDAVPTATTVRVTLLEGYEYFQVITEEGLDLDRLVGVEAQQEITGVSLYGTPATTTIWDEALLSDARQYPATGLVHRDRLFMAGFPQATNVIVASSVGNFFNFIVGVRDDEAINEELGDDPNAEIRHLVSSEQLLLFTDRSSYYVPEAGDNPITPESIAFLRMGVEGAAYCEPVIATEGALFIDAEAGRLMAAVPTGNVRRSWDSVELSEYSDHLLSNPVRIAVANGLDGRKERYVFVLNDDGTFAVMVYRRNSEAVGFAHWYRGTGTWEDVASVEDDVAVVSKIGSTYRLGHFNFAALTDDEISYASAVSNRDGDEVELVTNQCVVVTETVTSGEVPSQAPASGYSLGYDFATELTPASPIRADVGWRRQRIARTRVQLLNSGAVDVGSQRSWPFGALDDLDNPGALQSRTVEAYRLGWDNNAAETIKQDKGQGALLDVLAVTMEVA